MAVFRGGKNRNDTFVGTNRNDRFLFHPSDLTSDDIVVGNGGTIDTLEFKGPGKVAAAQLSHVFQVERILLSDGGMSIHLPASLVKSASNRSVTVVGGDGADTIMCSISNAFGAVVLDGGQGHDTLALRGFTDAPLLVDLSRSGDQLIPYSPGSDLPSAYGFENVDLSRVKGLDWADVHGSANANIIIGSPAWDVVYGGAGDDVLDGGASYGDLDSLHGEEGNDLLLGSVGNERTYLNGGSGSDVFRWVGRPTPDMLYALTTVEDFTSGEDQLEFGQAIYGFVDDDLSVRIVVDSATTDISGADLVIYPHLLDDFASFEDYLDHANGGSEASLFLATQSGDGGTFLYHSFSGTHGDPEQGNLLAVLENLDPAQLVLADFNLI